MNHSSPDSRESGLAAFRIDCQLQSPLISGEIDHFRKAHINGGQIRREHQLVIKDHPKTLAHYPIDRFVPDVLTWVSSVDPSPTKYKCPSLEHAVAIALGCYENSHKEYVKCMTAPPPPCFIRPESLSTDLIEHWYKWKVWFTRLYDEVGAKSIIRLSM